VFFELYPAASWKAKRMALRALLLQPANDDLRSAATVDQMAGQAVVLAALAVVRRREASVISDRMLEGDMLTLVTRNDRGMNGWKSEDRSMLDVNGNK